MWLEVSSKGDIQRMRKSSLLGAEMWSISVRLRGWTIRIFYTERKAGNLHPKT